MKITKEHMLLYGVTDRAWTGKKSLEEQIEEALRGGITCLQLREKGMSKEAFTEEAKSVKRLTERYGVPLIINDNIDVAIASGADGIHVGQTDMRTDQVRSKLGPDKIIGVSARTPRQAILAQEMGADYLGTGAVFGTSTKKDAKPIDRETVRAITASVHIPVVAIGGISESSLPLLAGTGVDGAAVVSALFGAEDIEKAAVRLKKLSMRMLEAKEI